MHFARSVSAFKFESKSQLKKTFFMVVIQVYFQTFNVKVLNL